MSFLRNGVAIQNGILDLIALPVMEWHDLDFMKMALKIANFAEQCVMAGLKMTLV